MGGKERCAPFTNAPNDESGLEDLHPDVRDYEAHGDFHLRNERCLSRRPLPVSEERPKDLSMGVPSVHGRGCNVYNGHGYSSSVAGKQSITCGVNARRG